MPLNQAVDLYCERTHPGLWSEPINAISNLGFLVAAWLVWRELRKLHNAGVVPPASVRALAPLLALVGVLSFLFHTLATLWAAIADQVGILVFGCVFLYAFLRHCAACSSPLALTSAVLFSVVSYATPRLLPAEFLNRSGGYLPYLAALLAMTVWLGWRRHAAWRGFAAATASFCVALALRTVDHAVCQQFPVGTHFLWHLANAGVLWLLAVTLARAAAAPVDDPGKRL